MFLRNKNFLQYFTLDQVKLFKKLSNFGHMKSVITNYIEINPLHFRHRYTGLKIHYAQKYNKNAHFPQEVTNK